MDPVTKLILRYNEDVQRMSQHSQYQKMRIELLENMCKPYQEQVVNLHRQIEALKTEKPKRGE